MHSERKGCVRRNNQIGSRILTTMSEGRRARVDLGVELHTKSAAFEDDVPCETYREKWDGMEAVPP